jgi:hypothetical protein
MKASLASTAFCSLRAISPKRMVATARAGLSLLRPSKGQGYRQMTDFVSITSILCSFDRFNRRPPECFSVQPHAVHYHRHLARRSGANYLVAARGSRSSNDLTITFASPTTGCCSSLIVSASRTVLPKSKLVRSSISLRLTRHCFTFTKSTGLGLMPPVRCSDKSSS